MTEPHNTHDAGCLVWLSDDPADACDCRGLSDPITRRQHLETEWRSLSLAERCRRLDILAS